MESRSALIGFASTSASPPPPKSAAWRRGMKDQVTASNMPRAASVRRTAPSRRRSGVSAGRVPACAGRARESAGMRSKPAIRSTSSTRSASPSTSPRQGGGCTATRSASPSSQPKPNAVRMPSASARSPSMPPSARTLEGRKAISRRQAGAVPATTTSLGSPPQSSITRRVMSSMPGPAKAGSRPRSKR